MPARLFPQLSQPKNRYPHNRLCRKKKQDNIYHMMEKAPAVIKKTERKTKEKRGKSAKKVSVEAAVSLEAQETSRTKLEETQHNLLLMEQSAAFYALHYGKDDPITRDFATARQELEDKMREELFQDWVKSSGYTGSSKKAEYPEADKRTADNEERAQSDVGEKPSEVVSHAPYTEEDLQKLLEQSKKPENADEQEANKNEKGGDNIVILNAGEVIAKRKEEPPLSKKAQDILRDAHKQEEDRINEEQDSESHTPKTHEQNRADELRKEIARLAEIGGASPEAVSSDIVRLQIELEKLEKGPHKKRRDWGWIKERIKGLCTVGVYEVIQ